MRSIRTLALAVTGILLAPHFALAADVEAEIRQMQDRLTQIETQLDTTNDELAEANATVAEQQATLEAANLEERQGESALSAFIESTDITGWVAASYNYNFKGTGATNMTSGGGNCGNSNATPNAPGNQGGGYCNPNTFQLDQAWLTFDKSPTSESRAGFHMEISAGQETSASPGAGGAIPINLETAYVSYLAPVLEGLQFDVGRQWTMIGYEVLAATGNWQVTRGATWGNQPVWATGAVAHLMVTEDITVSAGVLNEAITDPGWDVNGGKSLTSKVAYAADKFAASVAFNYGRDAGLSAERVAMVDVILSVDPMENLSAWINYDWRKDDYSGGSSGNQSLHQIALAARLGILESTGVSARFEYVTTDASTSAASSGSAADNDLITLTGTIDHGLTDNMLVKAEIRWDNSDVDQFTNNNGNSFGGDQVLGLLQVVYEF
jgi:hypothetical protein